MNLVILMECALRKPGPFDVVESFELNVEKFEAEWAAAAQREVDCVYITTLSLWTWKTFKKLDVSIKSVWF